MGTKYSHQGYIQIKEANADGKYVKLFNSGSQVSVFNGCFLCFYFFPSRFCENCEFSLNEKVAQPTSPKGEGGGGY